MASEKRRPSLIMAVAGLTSTSWSLFLSAGRGRLGLAWGWFRVDVGLVWVWFSCRNLQAGLGPV